MSTSHNTDKTNARTMFHRLAAGAALAAAPMLIALGAAATSQADTTSAQTDSGSISAPAHQPFRNQDRIRATLPYTSLSHHQKRNYPY